MFELLLCSSVTVLPDFLYRRFVQDKRLGRDITLFSVWYELRWGITTCLLLTIALITVIFYYHPSANSVTSYFRTVTILPEAGGRVGEVYARSNQLVQAGDPLFRLDDSQQRAAVDAAESAVAEAQAADPVARAELEAAAGQISAAQGAVRQAQEELDTREELRTRNPNVVSEREIERLQIVVETRQGSLDAAISERDAIQVRIDTLLPAQLAAARARLDDAQIALDKTLITAGVTGRVEQFALQPGDFVSPILRPAGILVPTEDRFGRFVAGFGQISAQVVLPGMIAEITCASLPFQIVPMVITEIQDVVSGGQFRPSDQLQDVQPDAASGTITAYLEPLYEGATDRIPPGSSCLANAYTSNHDRLQDGGLGTGERLFLHMVDTVGLVHALLLRIQAMLLPVQTLVLTGH